MHRAPHQVPHFSCLTSQEGGESGQGLINPQQQRVATALPIARGKWSLTPRDTMAAKRGSHGRLLSTAPEAGAPQRLSPSGESSMPASAFPGSSPPRLWSPQIGEPPPLPALPFGNRSLGAGSSPRGTTEWTATAHTSTRRCGAAW